MTRPILWAVGTLVGVTVWATVAGDRIATKLGSPSRRAPAAPVEAEPGRAIEASRALTLEGDLGGHFIAHPTLDGRRLRMLVDTGATYVALSYEDAQMIGIRVEPRDFTLRMSTANGLAAAAPVRIGEVRVGDISVRNVEAIVAQRGAMHTSLLGMSFLRRIGGFEISRGRLTLRG